MDFFAAGFIVAKHESKWDELCWLLAAVAPILILFFLLASRPSASKWTLHKGLFHIHPQRSPCTHLSVSYPLAAKAHVLIATGFTCALLYISIITHGIWFFRCFFNGIWVVVIWKLPLCEWCNLKKYKSNVGFLFIFFQWYPENIIYIDLAAVHHFFSFSKLMEFFIIIPWILS